MWRIVVLIALNIRCLISSLLICTWFFKNQVRNRLKIQFVELDFLKNQVQINKGNIHPLPDFQTFQRPAYLHKAWMPWTTLLQICVSYHIVLLGHNGAKNFHVAYRKIVSSNTSRLEAHASFFRLLMKGIFDPYVLWHFDQNLISSLAPRGRTRYYKVWCSFHQIGRWVMVLVAYQMLLLFF